MKYRFIKIPRHRSFQYDPIYFDPDKEKSNERERRIRKEMGLSVDEKVNSGYTERIRGGMRHRMKPHFEVSRSERKKSNIRLVIILIVLFALFYYLLNSAHEWYEQFLM